MSQQSNFAISYAFTNEKNEKGEVNKAFLKNYLENIASILLSKKNVEKVRHSLLPEIDEHIENNVWNNDDIAKNDKYQIGLNYCKKKILEQKINHVLFVLKYPLSNTKNDGVQPQESGGMKQELMMALQQDSNFLPSHPINRIVAIQDGMDNYPRTKKYIQGALNVLHFRDLEDLYVQIKNTEIKSA